MSLDFTKNVDDGFGKLIIEGTEIPYASYDPLGYLWADVRKRVREFTGKDDGISVDVAGAFVYREQDTVCFFHPNCRASELNGYDIDDYLDCFAKNFDRIIWYFATVVESFVDSPYGLKVYNKLVEKHHGDKEKLKEEIDKFFDHFLTKISVRTKEDNDRAAKCKQREAKKAAKRRQKK